MENWRRHISHTEEQTEQGLLPFSVFSCCLFVFHRLTQEVEGESERGKVV